MAPSERLWTVHSPPTSTTFWHQGRARITGCLPGPGSKSSLSILVFQFPSLRLLALLGHWQESVSGSVILGLWRGACDFGTQPQGRQSKKNNTPRKKQGMLLPSAFLCRPATFCTPLFQAHRFIKRWNFEFSTAEPGCKSEYLTNLTIYPPRNIPTIAVATHLPRPIPSWHVFCAGHPSSRDPRPMPVDRAAVWWPSGPVSSTCGKHFTQHLINSEENPPYQILDFFSWS